MNKFILIFFSLLSVSVLAQVGIGTEDPKVSLDIDYKGVKVEKSEDSFIRLEGLERRQDYLRKIILNTEGDVATMDYEDDNFNLKTLKYAKSQKTIHTEKSANVMKDQSNVNAHIDIELDIEVILSPNTENIIFLEYDVPIYIYNNVDNNSNSDLNYDLMGKKVSIGYMGVTMVKVGDDGILGELDQGSRKITNYQNRSSIEGDNLMGVSITGKAVDQIRNTEPVEKKVMYKLYAYVEKGNSSPNKDIYFGNAKGEIESLGQGIFNAVVYEKVISRIN
ncbi:MULTISPECIES: hypothetical protein [Myroides]|uniref:hypothetical protein n=1 Tax=Myroides TaxID=76831 RepID=UPI001303AE91|nr:hypothetical protein [Myroides phaeus]